MSVLHDYGYKLDSDGNPLITECQKKIFGLYYPSLESSLAFDALYDNLNGLQDKFIAYHSHTSGRFSNNKYVVGYDPLNEPWPGNFYKDPSLVIPGNFDKTRLEPMFGKIYDTLQTTNPSHTMWFEPAQIPDTAGLYPHFDKAFPVGF